MGDLSIFEVIVIAIVEGLTEFLPVSSTGHMIIAQNLLGVKSTEFVKAFTVIIQFGAIPFGGVAVPETFFRLNPVKVFDAEATAGKGTSTKLAIWAKRSLQKFDFC